MPTLHQAPRWGQGNNSGESQGSVKLFLTVKSFSFFMNPGGSDGKKSALKCRRPGFNLWVRKIPWKGNGSPLQYSCLENPMDGGAWWAAVHRVTKSRT